MGQTLTIAISSSGDSLIDTSSPIPIPDTVFSGTYEVAIALARRGRIAECGERYADGLHRILVPRKCSLLAALEHPSELKRSHRSVGNVCYMAAFSPDATVRRDAARALQKYLSVS